jgi:hypothetical protein
MVDEIEADMAAQLSRLKETGYYLEPVPIATRPL